MDSSEEAKLKKSYDQDSFCLMMIDPVKCFAYWDFSKKTFDNIRDSYHLRIFSRGKQIQEHEIGKEAARDFYIQHNCPGSLIEAVIGTYRGGHFQELLEKDNVKAPVLAPLESLVSASSCI